MPLCLEVRVAQIAPEHGEHAEPVGLLERAGDLDDLARGLLGPEVDRRADARGAHLVRALDRREHDLVELVRIREQLVVVQLHDEGELVRPLAADRAEDAERRGERVAAALDRELDEVLGVEVDRVRGEARRARVLDALVDREDRDVAGAGQPAGVDQPLQVAQDGGGTIAVHEHPVDEVRAGQVQVVLGDRLALVLEEALRVVSEQLLQAGSRHVGGGCHALDVSTRVRSARGCTRTSPRRATRWASRRS